MTQFKTDHLFSLKLLLYHEREMFYAFWQQDWGYWKISNRLFQDQQLKMKYEHAFWKLRKAGF